MTLEITDSDKGKNFSFTDGKRVIRFDLSNELHDCLKDYFTPKKVAKVPSKSFNPPTLEEVKSYFKEKGYQQTVADRAFDYYTTMNWKDGTGKQVLNWKGKMLSVWMKPEFKIKEEEKNKSKFFQ
jgi:hypothetical protein